MARNGCPSRGGLVLRGYICDGNVHSCKCRADWAEKYIGVLEDACYAALRNKKAWKVRVRAILGKATLKRMTEENGD